MTDPAKASEDARVVVIGGGIAGCSAAYHLAALGLTDVLLLERSTLSSGTTWHSTGNMETYRESALKFQMLRYAVDSFPPLQVESKQQLGWRNVGRVMYTDREARFEVFRALPELGRARGIKVELLSARAVAERLPIINSQGLLGGVWIPSDGCVNPTDVVMAYAKAARARGVKVRENIRVLEILTKGSSVCGVLTERGTVNCEVVVLAAGRWSSALAGTCGVCLPMYALEHQYIITETIPGLPRNLPLLLSWDDQLYGREEVGGLILGTLDDNAIPVSSPNTEESTGYARLEERWEQFEPYMKIALQRFPVLASTGIKMMMNGPESFTPDGEMLLGPVPGVDGLFSICAFNSNGIALAPAAGRFISEWIVGGRPSVDVAALDVRRFALQQGSPTYARERVTEIPGYTSRLHDQTDDYTTARNVRLSPIHTCLTASGAHFASVNGWERPLWIETRATQDWTVAVAEEAATVSRGCLLADCSSDVKIGLLGDCAEPWLASKLAVGKLPAEPAASFVAFPGELNQVEALGRILPWPGGWMLTAGPEQETRLFEWVRRARVPNGAHVVDLTAGWAMFEIVGASQAPVLRALCSEDGPPPSVCRVSKNWAGAARVRLYSDPVGASTLIFAPADSAVYVWQRLLLVGESVRIGGHYAMEALRIARGVPRFGQEATPAARVQDVVGSRQLARDFDTTGALARPTYKILPFSSAPGTSCLGAHEPILHQDRVIGEITSRACLVGWPETLSLGRVPTDCDSLTSLQMVAGGKRWNLSVRSSIWQPDPHKETHERTRPPFADVSSLCST